MWWRSIALAAELGGTLTGTDGEPIVGATVLVYDSRFNYGVATSRSGGAWAVVGLPADRYRIRFLPANDDPHGERFYGGAWDACEAESVRLQTDDSVLDGLDDTLEPGATVRGRVTDLDGAPIAGVGVSVYGAEPRTSLVLRDTETDADGTFSLVGLDADDAGSDFFVFFQRDGWPEQWLGPAYASDESDTVSLRPGTPSDLGDVALLDGIRVSGLITGPDGPVGAGTVIAYSTQQVLTEPVGADGRYVAEGLPPGDLVVWAQSPGLATTYYPDADRPSGALPVTGEGDEATIDLDLPVEHTLTLAADVGAEAEGVGVVVYNDTSTVGRGATFGPDGTLTVGALYPGAYAIYVSDSDRRFVSGFLVDTAGERRWFEVGEGGGDPVEVPLREAATLSGGLVDDEGVPVYGATVVVTETLGEGRTWSATSARDGTWTVPGVDATTVTVAVQFHWYCPDDLGYAATWYTAARREVDAAFVVVARGGEVHGLDLVLPLDLDHDGMGDAWEREHGLDPTRDDAAEDPDGDGFNNFAEWERDSDPNAAGFAEDCAGGCAGGPLVTLLLPAWGRRRRRR
jgi:hypothetical protein